MAPEPPKKVPTFSLGPALDTPQSRVHAQRMFRIAIGVFLMLTSSGLAAPQWAGVRVAEIYRQLPSAQQIAARATTAKGEINSDPRFAALAESLKELEALQSQVSSSDSLDRLSRERLQQQFIVKRDEAASLRREVEVFQSQELKKINSRMVSEMNSELKRIQEVAAEAGRTKGFDLVLDLTGKTNSSVPFVIYAKAPVDLTDDVLERLGVATPDPAPQSADSK